MAAGTEVEAEAARPQVIDSTFRNGSVTAIGVVVGFSLGFVSRWGGSAGEWSQTDLAAVAVITLGIILQIVALGLLLSVSSLRLSRYNTAIRCFITGLVLVGLGVGIALFAGIVGVPSSILSSVPRPSLGS